MNTNFHKQLERAHELLDAETNALTRADTEAATLAIIEREQIMMKLGETPISNDARTRAELLRLQKRSGQLTKLYEASVQGAKSAIERINALENACSNLNTYSQDGAVSDISNTEASREIKV